MKKLTICHVTTVHKRDDTRVFVKECSSLTSYHDVTLIVADGKGDSRVNDVNIKDIGKAASRLKRAIVSGFKACICAWKQKADIYHIHDPELVMFFSIFKLLGKKVVYDVHEDHLRQVLRKYWVTPRIQKCVRAVIYGIEWLAVRSMSGLVTVTPTISNKFKHTRSPVIEVRNYPLLDEFGVIDNSDYQQRAREILYVGGITMDRGIDVLLDCLALMPDVKLNLVGRFSNGELESFCKAHPAWKQVNFAGWCNRKQIEEQMKRSRIGMVVLQPTGDYEDALPVKLFEYMAAGLPTIYSAFPFWQESIREYDCGVAIDPKDTNSVKTAIEFLLDHPEKAQKMGEDGRKAVFTSFNWENESKKLLPFYNSILS